MAGLYDLDIAAQVIDDRAIAWDDPDYEEPVPASIAGLSAWYDASDTTRLTDAGSGHCSQLNDKSGNGFHLTQATDGLRPITGTRTIGGRNALDFDGTDDYIATASFATINQPVTWFAVALNDDGADGVVEFLASHNSTVNQHLVGRKTAGNLWSLNAGTVLTGGTVDSAAHSFMFQVNGATSVIRVDGVQAVAGTTGANALVGGLRLGTSGSLVSFWDGLIGEVLVYNRVLTAGEIAAVEAYLAAKWLTQSAAVSPVSVPVTPVALARTAGGVSLALTPATVTVTPQAVARVAAKSIALTPATVTVTPVLLARTAAKSVAVSPPSVVVTAQALGRTAAKSVAVTPSTVVVTPQAVARTVGGASVAVTPTTVPVAAQALGLTAAKSVALTPATVTVTATAVALTAGGATPALTPVSVAVAGQTLGLTAAASRAVTPATVTVTAVAFGRTVGGVSLALTPAEVTVEAEPFGMSAAGADTLPLTPATVIVEPEPFGMTAPTPRTLPLTPAEVRVVAITGTCSDFDAPIPFDADLDFDCGEHTDITPGGVTLALTPATVEVEAEPFGISTGGLPLTPATVQVEALELGITQGAPAPSGVVHGGETIPRRRAPEPLHRLVRGDARALLALTVYDSGSGTRIAHGDAELAVDISLNAAGSRIVHGSASLDVAVDFRAGGHRIPIGDDEIILAALAILLEPTPAG